MTTHLFSKSSSKTLLNFPIARRMQSCNGNDPPDKPVPAPLGTTFILFSLQYFKILLTSLTVSGKTTINGTCL